MSGSQTPSVRCGAPDKVRVLFLNTRSALGADVAVHLQLIQNLDPAAVDVFVATNRNSVDLAPTLAQLGELPVDRVIVADLGHEVTRAGGGLAGRIAGAARNLSAFATLLRLAGFVRRNRIDVIHSTERPRDAVFATLLALLTGRPNVLHAHIAWNQYFGRASRWAMDRCSAIITISQFTRDSFERAGFPASKVRMVYNATDAARFDPDRVSSGTLRQRLGIGPDTPLVGIVARIMLWKGHAELVEALAAVREALPNVRLAIVGTEDLLAARGGVVGFASQLKARIDGLGLTGSVHWLGWCEDMPAVMRDLGVLAMPSWEEPFGLAVTEALAMQTPVVGFASGALPEIVTDGVEGLLAPPRDVAALAAALTRLLSDPELRAEMGRKGRDRVLSSFTPRRQADEITAIYRSVSKRP